MSAPTPPLGYSLVKVGTFDNPPPDSSGPDPYLTAQTHLALERSPWAIRKHVPIQDVQVSQAQLPNGQTSLVDGRQPIAGVDEGNTGQINVYQPGRFADSGELASHEATHLIQNRLPAEQQASIPPVNPSNPYSELRLSLADLQAMRAGGDTLQKHSREGQATIIQKYQAVKDRVAKMSPQDQTDFMASRGQFKGTGNAELMATYEPYLEDEESLSLPGDKVIQQTKMPSPPLGYTLEP